MPAAEIALLGQIIKADYQETPSGDYHAVVLKERQSGAKLQRVEIRHLGADALVIFPDKGQAGRGCLCPMLDQSEAQIFNKACDAVIFCTHKGVHYRVLCELKSNNPRGTEAQFTGTLCFLGYLEAIIREAFKAQPVVRHTRRIVFNSAKTSRHTLDKTPVNPRAAACLDDHRIRYLYADNSACFGLGALV